MPAREKNSVKNSVPGRNGGTLLPGGKPGNRGGRKGRSGRTPDQFKKRMAELLDIAEVETYLLRCLRGEEGSKAFVAAVKYATERAYDKPGTSVTVKGDESQPITFRVVRE